MHHTFQTFIIPPSVKKEPSVVPTVANMAIKIGTFFIQRRAHIPMGRSLATKRDGRSMSEGDMSYSMEDMFK